MTHSNIDLINSIRYNYSNRDNVSLVNTNEQGHTNSFHGYMRQFAHTTQSMAEKISNFKQTIGYTSSRSFTYSFARSATHSFARSATHSFARSATHSFARSASHSFGRSGTHSFARSATHSFARSASHSFGRSGTYSLADLTNSRVAHRYLGMSYTNFSNHTLSFNSMVGTYSHRFLTKVDHSIKKLDNQSFASIVSTIKSVSIDEAKKLISDKEVTVNGLLITDPEHTLSSLDIVRIGFEGHYLNNPHGIAIIK